MGEVFFRGPQAEEAVQRLVTRDVSRLAVGQAGYAAVCYESGGTVDDVLVYRRPDDFLIVVNASNREKDLDTSARTLKTSTSRSRISRMTGRCSPCRGRRLWTTGGLYGDRSLLHQVLPICGGRGRGHGCHPLAHRLHRGGMGFEIFFRPDDAPRVWRALVGAGAVPVGLGARDTLRLEAGMCLYGNELDARLPLLRPGSASRST
jgi:aminomethyltransferase